MVDLQDVGQSNDQRDGEKLQVRNRVRLNYARTSLPWIDTAQKGVHNDYTHGSRRVAIYDNMYSALFPYKLLHHKNSIIQDTTLSPFITRNVMKGHFSNCFQS
jgi:hypothetical protein